MKPKTNHQKFEKGQSLVELAVSLVVLIIILAGVVDVGRAIFYYLGMRDAAEEGLIYGVAFPRNCTQIEDRVLGSLSDPNIQVQIFITNASNAPVLCSAALNTTKCYGHTMTLQVSNPNFPITMPMLGTFLGRQSISLRATVNGQILRPLDCNLP
jgi:hypothetical protein